MTSTKIDCEHCGARFERGRVWAKFCSPECRLRAHRAKKDPAERHKLGNAKRTLLAAIARLDAGEPSRALEHVRRAAELLAKRRRARNLDSA